MSKLLRETATLSERAAAEAKKTGRMLVQFADQAVAEAEAAAIKQAAETSTT